MIWTLTNTNEAPATMTPLTLNKARKVCKKSKSTILEAIRLGRLSANKDHQHQWQIDPDELLRLYPANQSRTANLLEEIANFKQKLKKAKDERHRLQATIDELHEILMGRYRNIIK